jgi:drug/metabolite transporter (DMT)-like permease
MLAASASLFGFMAFTAKLASARLGGAQIAMVRFLVSLVPIFAVRSYRQAAFTFHRIDLLFYRGFFGGLAVLCYFLAIEHIPVGVATLLNYTAPVFSGLFAAFFIGERLRLRVLLPLAAAFGGLLLVVHAHAQPGDLTGFGKWELVGAVSALLSGAAVTAIRVARRTESSWSIFASFSLFGFLACAPFGIAHWKNPTVGEWSLLVTVGVISIGAQLLMTSALRWVETVTAGVISQFAVVVSMILGAIWLNEIPNALSLLGSALTIGGVVSVMAVSARAESSTFDEPPEQ